MTELLFGVILGLLTGAAFVYYFFVRQLKEQVSKDFKVAAVDAVNATGKQLIESGLKDIRQVKTEADHSFEKKSQEIGHSVSQMRESLKDYHRLLSDFTKDSSSVHGSLQESLKQVLDSARAVQIETNSLKNALKSGTGVRGNFGEMVLRDILEQNSLLRGVHYEEQVLIPGNGSGDSRPDFVIHLSDGKRLIIDSKEVGAEYLLAQEADGHEDQQRHLEKLVANIRTNFIKLSRKEYQELLDPEIPYVVMFVPSEPAIRAAYDVDPTLFREAADRRVILASPMTIIPLIYLIKNNWQQHKLAENARELGGCVEELGNRLYSFLSHLQNVKSGIKKAADGWDKAVNSWHKRVVPQIDKTKNLGGKLKDSEPLEDVRWEPTLLKDAPETRKK